MLVRIGSQFYDVTKEGASIEEVDNDLTWRGAAVKTSLGFYSFTRSRMGWIKKSLPGYTFTPCDPPEGYKPVVWED